MVKETVYLTNSQQMTVPEEKIDMYAAFEILEKENLRLLAQKQQGSCTVNLYDKKDKLLFSENVTFPLENDIEVVLSELILSKKNQDDKDLIQVKTKNEKKTTEVRQEPNDPKVASQQEPNEKRTRVKKQRVKRERKESEFSKSTLIKAGVLLLSFMVGGSIAWFSFSNLNDTSQQKPTIEILLKEKKYGEAVNEYPKDKATIVNYLYEENNKSQLEKFNKKYPTKQGLFFEAFLNQEWEKVVSVKGVKPTEETQLMLGYAYLQLGKIEEAKIINKEIKSKTLAKNIKRYELESAYHFLQDGKVEEAKNLNKDLKNSQLNKDIALTQSIVNLIQKSEKDSNDPGLSPEEREEAKNNLEAWKTNLKQIGADQSND